MNYDLILAIVFYAVLYFLFFKYRTRFDVQGKFFILYRTQLGIKLMDQIARKIPRILRVLGYVSITAGFAGMIFMFYFLIKGTLSLLTTPEAPPILTPVLPGIETIPGVPILSFWHWIIAILVIAIVHEFMHGVYARLHNIPIKSSGFAFLGPLLAAFVEPNEKVMNKKKTSTQLAILSAGPFANILFAGVTLLLLFFVLNPLATNMVRLEGVRIVDINTAYPIAQTPITTGMEITAINTAPIRTYDDFLTQLRMHNPGDAITVTANNTSYTVILGADTKDSTRPVLGVNITPARVVIKDFFQRHTFLYATYSWLMRLIFWIFTINLGVGLFNLLPLGPIDGGRMFLVAATGILRNQQKARKIWVFVTLVCLLLIFINILPFIVKSLKFLATPIITLITFLF